VAESGVCIVKLYSGRLQETTYGLGREVSSEDESIDWDFAASILTLYCDDRKEE
jgi:hypothetical protein